MHASAIAIWAIVIVAVVGLAIWLVGIGMAARKPYQEPHGGRLRGPVTGGTHVGGGRSVAPRRDAEVNPDQTSHGDTVSPRLDPPEPEPEPNPANSRDQ